MLVRKPVDYSEKQFYFSFQTGVGWCWLDQEQKRVLTSLQLADYLVSEFVSLAENVARGKISHSDDDEYV